MSEYTCKNCTKTYKYRQNLHRHMKNCFMSEKHEDESNDNRVSKRYPKGIQNTSEGIQKGIQNGYPDDTALESNGLPYRCNYCNRGYKYKSGKYKHQKKCLSKSDLVSRDEMDNKIEEIKETMLQFMNKNFKMHHKTFAKLQRDLRSVNNTTNNNTNNTTNNNNNSINNSNNTINNTLNNITGPININIIPLGKEDFIHTLDKETQLAIVNKVYNSIKYFLDVTHFNPATPQYQSFVITNTQNNIAYIYDGDTKQYIVTTKDDLMNCLFHERGCDIRDFIEYNEDDIKPYTLRRINTFMDKLETDNSFIKKQGGELKVYIYNKTRDIDINDINDDINPITEGINIE